MLRLLAIVGVLAVGVARLPGSPSEDSAAATIIDSGSTNRSGFRIVIEQTGAAELTVVPRGFGARQARPDPVHRTIPKTLVDSFYSSLKSAGPLASLPAEHCMKSASFGSKMTVSFGGEETPDLNCGDGGSATLADLIKTVGKITALMQKE
jgi:hypothetical protein